MRVLVEWWLKPWNGNDSFDCKYNVLNHLDFSGSKNAFQVRNDSNGQRLYVLEREAVGFTRDHLFN
jgi:hypothetical protein